MFRLIEKKGISASALAKFLSYAPADSTVRGYEGEVEGIVIEASGGLIELATWHNDGRVEITSEGRKHWPADDWTYQQGGGQDLGKRALLAVTEVTYGTDPAPAGFVTTALLVATPGQEWQPIATAPRDGTVIVGRSDTRIKLTFWNQEVGAFVLVYDGPAHAAETLEIRQQSRRVGKTYAVMQGEKFAPVIERFDPVEWKEADWF